MSAVPTLSDIASCYSDLHKSAYGFRPSLGGFYDMSEAERVAEFERVQRASEDAVAEEREAEAEAVRRFEAHVASSIAIGAGDRATAIRWIREANDWTDDEMEYELGLPYGYLRRAGAAS